MELTITNIIKIILGVLVIAAVAYGLYIFFTNHVIDSFKNIGINVTADTIKFLMILY
ncbi:MAG: hypothetical protein AABY32_00535 [Nanoarchaeota archaeon]